MVQQSFTDIDESAAQNGVREISLRFRQIMDSEAFRHAAKPKAG
jgi:hypothetical protein